MAGLGVIGSVLVCDDIRREISNKDIIIGVYSSDIIVAEFPAIVPLAFYIEYSPAEAGLQTLFIRMFVPGASTPAVAAIEMDVPSDRVGKTMAVPLTTIPFQFAGEGELLIEASADRDVWSAIKRKPIVRGSVNLLAPATLSSPPRNL